MTSPEREAAKQFRVDMIYHLDELKKKVIDPIALLNLVYLRVFLNEMSEEDLEYYYNKMRIVCSR